MNASAWRHCFFLLLATVIQTHAAPAQDPGTAPPSCGVVFVADGSGRLRNLSADLAQAVGDAGLPLQVRSFNWSHGTGRVFLDLRGRAHHQQKGRQLAECVVSFHETNPGEPIFLVGHSSGTAVVLAAAENLPPGSVDGIVLLAPAVSPRYDLRPALQVSAGGVDSFYSPRDLISRAQVLSGTADGRFSPSAGCAPFVVPDDGVENDCYSGLRQHRYGLHGEGGHFDCTRRRFLRDNVVPLLGSRDP